ncbi:MAG: NADH-quinone oxidoreductase subunit A [candidate division WOR-3 bacterium]
MKFFNFLIYFLTLSFFFFILIFKKEEKNKGAPYEGGAPSDYNLNIKVEIKFLKIVILFLILNTSIVYLLPWAYKLEKTGFFGLFFGLIFLFILLFSYFYILREKGIE